MFTESDRRVLVALYETTGGERWTINRGWMSTAPLSEWEGVSVEATGRVTKCLLEDRNLSGITMLTFSHASY
jgi:hypothetical protein